MSLWLFLEIGWNNPTLKSWWVCVFAEVLSPSGRGLLPVLYLLLLLSFNFVIVLETLKSLFCLIRAQTGWSCRLSHNTDESLLNGVTQTMKRKDRSFLPTLLTWKQEPWFCHDGRLQTQNHFLNFNELHLSRLSDSNFTFPLNSPGQCDLQCELVGHKTLSVVTSA